MVQCAKCGTHFEGRYCPNCGAPAEAAAEKPFTQPDYAAPVPPPVTAGFVSGVPSNWASVICYVIPIAGPLIFLMLSPYNRNRKIRFDAWQALFLQIAWLLLQLVIGVLNPVSWKLASLLWDILELAYFALVVVMAVKSYQSEKYALPVIGPYAEKQA